MSIASDSLRIVACVKRDRSNTPPARPGARPCLFRRCLVRDPRPEETERLLAFDAEQKVRIQKQGAESLKVPGMTAPPG